MITDLQLKIGEKLEIEPYGNKENDDKTIVSQLIDLKGNVIYISHPILEGNLYPLYEGQIVKIIFFRHDKGVFRFKGKVTKQLTKRELPIFEIKPMGEIEKIQRRYFYRLKSVLKVLVSNLKKEEKIKFFTKDISGGGLRIISKEPFDIGDKVKCDIELSDEFVTVIGQIVRSIHDPIKKEYEIGIHFTEMDEETRNKIITFIFEKQRLLRKKGLM